MDVAISKIKASMTKKVSDRVHILTNFFQLLKSGRQHEVVQFLKRQCDRSGMNLLEKEFLFIPVCEHTHWSLVLLCHIGTNYHTQRAKIIEIKRQIDARFEREEKIRMEKLIEREKEAANNREGRQEHKEDAILKKELSESNELENTGVPEMSYGDVVTPCILLLDSLKAHRAQAVFPKLRKLFMALHNDKIAEQVTVKWKCPNSEARPNCIEW